MKPRHLGKVKCDICSSYEQPFSRSQRQNSLRLLQPVLLFGDGSHHAQMIWNQFDLSQYSPTCFSHFCSGYLPCVTTFAMRLPHTFPVKTEAQKKKALISVSSVEQEINIFLCFLSTSNADTESFPVTVPDTLCLCHFWFLSSCAFATLVKLRLVIWTIFHFLNFIPCHWFGAVSLLLHLLPFFWASLCFYGRSLCITPLSIKAFSYEFSRVYWNLPTPNPFFFSLLFHL